MITYAKWIEGCDGYAREWQAFLESEAGSVGMNVLTNRLMTELMRQPLPDANMVDVAAITGSEANGYRSCLMHMQQLGAEHISKIKETKKAKESLKIEGTTLPIPPEIKEQVDRKYRTISRKQ